VKRGICLTGDKYWKFAISDGSKKKKLYLFAYKMFFCDGKMFLKKRQNLLTIIDFLLKSIYLTENTFVFGMKTKENGGKKSWLNW